MLKKSKKKIGKTKSTGKWKKDADAVFSRYIRLKNSIDGYCTCVTCGATKPIKEMQNGHYIPRSHLNTRYDERNCHPQCKSCNIFAKGRMDEYAIYLRRRYGGRILEELNKKKHKLRQIKPYEYEEMIEDWKQQIKEMENGQKYSLHR